VVSSVGAILAAWLLPMSLTRSKKGLGVGETKKPAHPYRVVKAAGFNFLISPSFGLTSQCSHINAGGGLMYCYKGTNITVERVVNHSKTQLNDALIEFYWLQIKKTAAQNNKRAEH